MIDSYAKRSISRSRGNKKEITVIVYTLLILLISLNIVIAYVTYIAYI